MKWLIILLTMFPGLNKAGDSENVRIWTVAKESRISILGSSNVNTFTFDIKEYSGKDTLVALQQTKQTKAVFKKGKVHLPVNDFKNPNPFLTKDFRKIIRSKSHPDILMNFKSLNSLPEQGAKSESISADVEISIAGKSKTFRICLLATRSGNVIYLKGNERLCFSDFGLAAPENIMGFIHVKDELSVNFQLALKVIN
jgi:hypothetical protein